MSDTSFHRVQEANESHHMVVNGHHLAVFKWGKFGVKPRVWWCRGCNQHFDSKSQSECPDPTTWVQLGAPGDGLGRCRECDALFVFERESPFYEQTCPECGSIDWYRTDETEPDPEGVTATLNCSSQLDISQS